MGADLPNENTRPRIFQEFRLRMARLLAQHGHETGGNYLYQYWRAHPISRENDSVIVYNAYSDSIEHRQHTGNPLMLGFHIDDFGDYVPPPRETMVH